MSINLSDHGEVYLNKNHANVVAGFDFESFTDTIPSRISQKGKVTAGFLALNREPVKAG